jgi:dipeptide transport system ATP-binding protein
MTLLDIEQLQVSFGEGSSAFSAVQGLDMHVDSREIVGIVGESGSGKTVAMLALLGLIDPPGKVTASRLSFSGGDLLHSSRSERRRIVGKDIAMIFQDPAGSLNPAYSIGYQIVEALRVHLPASRKAMRARAIELLAAVGIPEPEARFHAYPHQLSGGMCQRAMIAMAISCEPKLLIADEPTTALDVTVQAQIIELLLELQARHNVALILISHNLALVSQVASRVMVMYAGEVVEEARACNFFRRPKHPYSEALLAAMPENNPLGQAIYSLDGLVPGQQERLSRSCLLVERCRYAEASCREQRPPLRSAGEQWRVRCLKPLPHGSIQE